VQSFQADCEQVCGACLIVSGGTEGLQNQFSFHGVNSGAHGELDAGKIAGAFGGGAAKFLGQS